jgi:hypothetical protein
LSPWAAIRSRVRRRWNKVNARQHFDRQEAVPVQGDDVTRGCFLHVAVGRLGVETLDESLGKLNRLQFRAPRLLDLAQAFCDVQGVVFFSP